MANVQKVTFNLEVIPLLLQFVNISNIIYLCLSVFILIDIY